MSSKIWLLIGGIVVVVAAGVLVVTQYGQRDGEMEQPVEEEPEMEEERDDMWGPDMIEAEHLYEEGEHTIAGEVSLPTPCHSLEGEAEVMESSPEQVVLEFTSDYEDEDRLCAQVMTDRPFRIEFDASEEASISARFNGRDVDLNLFRVDSLDDLEEFDPERKG